MTGNDELADTFAGIDAVATAEPTDRGITLRLAGGAEVHLVADTVATATAATARRVTDPAGADHVAFVVADRIPGPVRAQLDAAGIGWWDRRGHLKFHHGHVWVDVDVPVSARAPSGADVDPLAGRVAAAVAFEALLVTPEALPGVRALARATGASAGGVSLAVRRFVDAGLLTDDHRAARPGLFWAVVSSWAPSWVDLGTVPGAADDLVATGSRAAAARGAPVAVSDDYPVELLAATAAAVRRLHRRHPVVGGAVAARVAVAPAAAAVVRPPDGVSVGPHPAAHDNVVALTLAKDPSRGAEILEAWEPGHRAW